MFEADDTDMPKMDAALTRDTLEHFEGIRLWVKCRGPLKEIKFLHVSEADYDDYEAVFQDGALEWEVAPLDADQAAHQTSIRYFNPQPATRRFGDWLKSIQRGRPDYGALTPELASKVRDQSPGLQASFKKWGWLESVYFMREPESGAYIYLATFEHRRVVWKVGALDNKDRLTVLNYAEAPD